MKGIRKQVYLALEVSEDQKGISRWVDIFLTLLIILNVVAIVLESMKGIYEPYKPAFRWFDVFSVVIFTIEYVARVWSSVENPALENGIKGRLRFMGKSMVIIDLLAILPFYLAFLPLDLRVLRVLRLFRIFRLFKIARYVYAIRLIGQAYHEKRAQLTLSLVFIIFMLFIVSSVMYYIENEAQPEAFNSIINTMWWGVATLTTVGYGDVYPITLLGKFFGGIIAILGVGLFALPAGIMASGFTELMERSDDKVEGGELEANNEKNNGNSGQTTSQEYNGQVICPHCGKKVSEPCEK